MANKETKEAVLGILAIAELLALEFKDGVQAQDVASIVSKILSNDELKKRLLEAYNGIDQVPSEIKAMGVGEVVDIVSASIPHLVGIIGAVKK